MGKKTKLLAICILFICVMSPPVFPEVGHATLFVWVTHPDGSAILNADVVAVSDNVRYLLEQSPANDGIYFGTLGLGSYSVEINGGELLENINITTAFGFYMYQCNVE